MCAAIMRGEYLNVFEAAGAVRPFVFNPQVWELHAVIHDRQILFVGPACDRFPITSRLPRRVAAAPIGLLKKDLVVALQVIVQPHARNAATIVNDAVSRVQVGSEQPTVVSQLPVFGSTTVSLPRRPTVVQLSALHEQTTAVG